MSTLNLPSDFTQRAIDYSRNQAKGREWYGWLTTDAIFVFIETNEGHAGCAVDMLGVRDQIAAIEQARGTEAACEAMLEAEDFLLDEGWLQLGIGNAFHYRPGVFSTRLASVPQLLFVETHLPEDFSWIYDDGADEPEGNTKRGWVSVMKGRKSASALASFR